MQALHDRTGCSLPGPSVREIFQARTLQWAASACSRASPDPDAEPVSPVLRHLGSPTGYMWAQQPAFLPPTAAQVPGGF